MEKTKEYFEEISNKLLDFIGASPSCYHVIDNVKKQLEEKGFQYCPEEKKWNLQKGKKYFTTRNGSSLIAFKIPEQEYINFQMIASHSDSPSFKIKENEELFVDGHYVELNTEKYGGMLCAPWFDRPLSVAGRAVVREKEGLAVKLVHFDEDLLMIPNLAIHMDRQLNQGYAYNAQKDMIPLLGDARAKGQWKNMVASQVQAAPEDVLSTDLFLYNRMSGTIWGANREFISSTKLDDLQCAYSTLMGFIDSSNKESASVYCLFDNEEVGSQTKQGAGSTFLKDVLERIGDCMGKTVQEHQIALANSFLVSADNAHAVSPNHLDKADPTNRPYMNGGIVIKYNANQKYTTDSVSSAVFQEICRRADVPVQTYINRSDVPGGSTLGNIVTSQISVSMVDVGLAQLAMHSPYETAGIEDTAYLLEAAKKYYSTTIKRTEEGIFQLG